MREIVIQDFVIEEIADLALEKLDLQKAPDARHLLCIAIKGAAALAGAKFNFCHNQHRASWEALGVAKSCIDALAKEMARGEEAVSKAGGAPS